MLEAGGEARAARVAKVIARHVEVRELCTLADACGDRSGALRAEVIALRAVE